MQSLHLSCNNVLSAKHLALVQSPLGKPALRPARGLARRSSRNAHRMAIFAGDIVADDKQTEEKTAAASSRGFAGAPEPKDMPQSTPAASPFMQVNYSRSRVSPDTKLAIAPGKAGNGSSLHVQICMHNAEKD